MTYNYKCKGVCSSSIDLDISGGIVKDVRINGGCAGNTKGICTLAIGMDAKELASKLDGVCCGNKQTSCPDQLARAINEAINLN